MTPMPETFIRPMPLKLMTKFLLSLVLVAFFAVPAVHGQREKFSQEDVAFIEKTWPTAKKTATGETVSVLSPKSMSAQAALPKKKG